jgi:hypothetical protein
MERLMMVRLLAMAWLKASMNQLVYDTWSSVNT